MPSPNALCRWWIDSTSVSLVIFLVDSIVDAFALHLLLLLPSFSHCRFFSHAAGIHYLVDRFARMLFVLVTWCPGSSKCFTISFDWVQRPLCQIIGDQGRNSANCSCPLQRIRPSSSIRGVDLIKPLFLEIGLFSSRSWYSSVNSVCWASRIIWISAFPSWGALGWEICSC